MNVFTCVFHIGSFSVFRFQQTRLLRGRTTAPLRLAIESYVTGSCLSTSFLQFPSIWAVFRTKYSKHEANINEEDACLRGCSAV